MKVLLTGASGFIGQHLLQQLLKANVEVIVLGRRKPDFHTGQFIKIDLLQTEIDQSAIKDSGATQLIHLAWYTEHEKYWTSPINLRWVEATTRLVEAFCAAGGKKVLLSGTCAEYDWSYGYLLETETPLKPSTMYGCAKDATRRLVAAICEEYHVKCVWARIFIPYGPGEDSRRLIPSLFDVFLSRRAPFAVNEIAFRDFIHVSDVAAALVTLNQSEANGVFNVSSGYPLKIREIVEKVAKACKADPNAVLSLSNQSIGGPILLVGDNRKLIQLGWQQNHRIDDLFKYK